ncbi:hypothetical protein [Celerinatantimonas sp. YJH-8]|uniref:hypothetical protein n=1 Tax=Celerinatantimonas sp. YJH-8 TaxID=3228714 RepID=UPI0038C0F7DA
MVEKNDASLVKISEYLEHYHVLTVAGQDHDGLWAANCFYVWDRENVRFIILADLKTRHGRIMQETSQVCGTVSDQESNVSHLQGVQFVAQSERLAGESEKAARALFYQKFPIARARPSPIWGIYVQSMKMMNNRLGFGTKKIWTRSWDVNLDGNDCYNG